MLDLHYHRTGTPEVGLLVSERLHRLEGLPGQVEGDLLIMIKTLIKLLTPERVVRVERIGSYKMEIHTNKRVFVGECTVWRDKETGKRPGTVMEGWLWEVWHKAMKCKTCKIVKGV